MSDTQPTLEAIYNYLKKLDGKIDILTGRVDGLDTRVVKATDKLDDLIVSHADLKAELRAIKRRLDQLESTNAPTGQIK